MAFTIDQLLAQHQALDEAINSGAYSVSYDGKMVTYRSLAEMIRIRDGLARRILGAPRMKRVLVNSQKGL